MSNPQRKFVIGRDRGCDIALAHDTVSSHHAELAFLAGGKLLLTDCKSRNGTFRLLPDGQAVPVRQELVSPMDRVRFGDVALSVREVLDALRLKFPNFDDSPRPPARASEPQVQGKRLERCDCGAVKVVGQACPECGR